MQAKTQWNCAKRAFWLALGLAALVWLSPQSASCANWILDDDTLEYVDAQSVGRNPCGFDNFKARIGNLRNVERQAFRPTN